MTTKQLNILDDLARGNDNSDLLHEEREAIKAALKFIRKPLTLMNPAEEAFWDKVEKDYPQE